MIWKAGVILTMVFPARTSLFDDCNSPFSFTPVFLIMFFIFFLRRFYVFVAFPKSHVGYFCRLYWKMSAVGKLRIFQSQQINKRNFYIIKVFLIWIYLPKIERLLIQSENNYKLSYWTNFWCTSSSREENFDLEREKATSCNWNELDVIEMAFSLII